MFIFSINAIFEKKYYLIKKIFFNEKKISKIMKLQSNRKMYFKKNIFFNILDLRIKIKLDCFIIQELKKMKAKNSYLIINYLLNL